MAALPFRISALYLRIETYASSKMLGRQFSLPPEIALAAVGSLSGYQLAWLYYGHSHAYALILGLIQLGGGALLLFRKTALLDAALTLPVMTNIVIINVFFHIAWGAMGTSAFIFASMLAVLWHSRHALVGVFWTDQAGGPASVRRYHRTIAALVVLPPSFARSLRKGWGRVPSCLVGAKPCLSPRLRGELCFFPFVLSMFIRGEWIFRAKPGDASKSYF